MNLPRRILDLFFPGTCDLCGGKIGENDFIQICAACAASLKTPENLPSCDLCAHPLAEGECPSCLGKGFGFSPTRSLFLNEGKGQSFLYDYKFHRRRRDIPVIASLAVGTSGDFIRSFDVLIPVPLAQGDYFEREFCPVTEPVKRIARKTGRPWLSPFYRAAGSGTQHFQELEERLAGAYEKYRFKKKFAKTLAGKKVLLVDDILTTGATLAALARRLREEADVKSCGALTFARSVLEKAISITS